MLYTCYLKHASHHLTSAYAHGVPKQGVLGCHTLQAILSSSSSSSSSSSRCFHTVRLNTVRLKTLRSCLCHGNIWVQYWVSCCRHVSVTMKNYRPEMVLGSPPQSPVTEGGLAIRVGSFSGKPITPKSRRGPSNLGPAGGGPEPSGNKSKATFSKVCIAAKCSQCSLGGSSWHQILITFPQPYYHSLATY